MSKVGWVADVETGKKTLDSQREERFVKIEKTI